MEVVIAGGLITLTGLFLLFSAIRKAAFLYEPPTKATGKLIHSLVYDNFGEKGIRNLAFLSGGVVVLLGLFLMSLPYSHGIANALRSKKSPPKVLFTGLINNPMNPDELMMGQFFLAMDIREAPLNEADNNVFEGTVTNNDLRAIPNKIWNMKRLKTLDISNNKLAKINTDSLRQLDSLRLLTLSGNPFDTLYIEQLRQQFPSIEIVF